LLNDDAVIDTQALRDTKPLQAFFEPGLFTGDRQPCYKAIVGIVVADSSALLRLARFGQLDALTLLCRQVFFPAALWKELNRETTSPHLLAWLHRPNTPRVVCEVPSPAH